MIDYEIVDMFTDTAFEGCALGVVPDATALDDTGMRAVACEIGLTETAFVLPPESAGATHRVRVFTPERESPYGGHSAVGTATTLVRLGRLPAGESVQECGGRLLTVRANDRRASLRVRGEPVPPEPLDPAPLLAACGLTAGDLVAEPCVTGFGPAFHVLPVRPEAVARAVHHPEHPVWSGCPDAVVVAHDSRAQRAEVRVFAPGYGMPEDPACASAALGLGAWLAQSGRVPADGTWAYRVRQGEGLGRPARLDCAVTVRGGRAVAAEVTGEVVATAAGRMRLPRTTAVTG
ncbi:Trans-2,3-dihydro-3-hydroxyanthranilate isomerase [Streptomyces sp. RB17]|uniref:PhzF family phenazine biosynthesis protein n=1 Tax=Streptomyces sp. RB17 TaxID=2585197 RepID=UPI001297CC66|nr:PhzF family phenazine biosynthesis protein [Streptomyces sp. RB17]MQY33693.1 Trans-2,3-dihydro-3-hydroxyanthranilate isomerase [Streptomyces sp. RB17]